MGGKSHTYSGPSDCWFDPPALLQIDVKSSKDVSAAFRYVKKTKIPLVIKNTGVSETAVR
jgi:hypothetical protein